MIRGIQKHIKHRFYRSLFVVVSFVLALIVGKSTDHSFQDGGPVSPDVAHADMVISDGSTGDTSDSDGDSCDTDSGGDCDNDGDTDGDS